VVGPCDSLSCDLAWGVVCQRFQPACQRHTPAYEQFAGANFRGLVAERWCMQLAVAARRSAGPVVRLSRVAMWFRCVQLLRAKVTMVDPSDLVAAQHTHKCFFHTVLVLTTTT
jgi:hypothetical protein